MNNRGFAITTILFGLMILFCLLLTSLLSLLSIYKGNVEKLVESDNAAREEVTMIANKNYSSIDSLKAETDTSKKKRGLYCFGASHTECRYVSNVELK